MIIHGRHAARCTRWSLGQFERLLVAAVWCDLFGVSRVEPEDDFFALGGHSMLAVRMASRLRPEPGLRVPVRTILENPTVEGLAGLLAEALEEAAGRR